MKKKYLIRSVKIQSSHKKNAPGFAYAYEYHPELESEKDSGSIFGVIEIVGNAESSKDIAELILTTLKEAYYDNSKKEILAKFEGALGSVNEALVAAAEDGKIAWLGKLHAVIAVLKDSELHITQVGSAEGYLLRKKALTQITEDLSPKGMSHPLKTFVNIASGQVDKGDKIVFFTPSLIFNISKEEIKRELTNYASPVAFNKFYHVLEDLRVPNRLSFMALDIIDPEALANDTSDYPDEYWLDEAKNVSDNFINQASPLIEKAAERSKDVLVKGKSIGEKLLPYKNLAAKHISKIFSAIKSKANKVKKPSRRPTKNIHPYRARGTKIKHDISFKRFMPGLKYIKKGYKMGVIALSLVVVLFVGVKLAGNKKTDDNLQKIETYNQYLKDASVLQTDAVYKIAANQKDDAKKDLDKAKDLVLQVENSKFKDDLKDSIATLKRNILETYDQLEGIIKTDPAKVVELEKSFDKFIYASKGFNLFSKDGYAKVDLEGKNYKLVENVATDVLAGDVLEDGTFIFLSGEPMVYSATSLEVKRQTLSVGDWYKAKDLVAFYNKIFILDDDGKIHRHERTIEGFTKASLYYEDTLLQDAVGLAVDSSIYVLNKDGSVIKLGSGKKQDFALKNSPILGEPSLIYASQGTGELYIFDNKNAKLAVFDKTTGEFKKLLSSDKFNGLTSITADSSGNVYFLAGKSIYKLPN
ncbi:MAG: hypothetical protein UT66_C0027G0006 [candidate division CPR2 bacterium GW2011_GWC1_39_9]|uniref:PPM-type phosphatase domain-containing protein n=1 Tax=candidate division CPR2 bacterium GW2011_GWC2_39_10 TaxID=1618345 RepID=A0A0G0M029_UNCC2|nr:MAG: hypothetical protein UT18_C0017G0015 [candidate division CPR2 bacterium GW2011_GWC2_39_10]KKR34175.1 MAG: hypothetical protein UT66_C0027G0006 [candidate division CPR2 bacterium GW2011_GWC1_39_9]